MAGRSTTAGRSGKCRRREPAAGGAGLPEPGCWGWSALVMVGRPSADQRASVATGPESGPAPAGTAFRGGTRHAGGGPAVPPSLIAVPCLPARFRATLSVELLRPVLLGVVRAGGCRRRYHPRLAGAVLPA